MCVSVLMKSIMYYHRNTVWQLEHWTYVHVCTHGRTLSVVIEGVLNVCVGRGWKGKQSLHKIKDVCLAEMSLLLLA